MRDFDYLEIKAGAFCVLAFVLGLVVASIAGCSTTTEAKLHTGGKTFSAAAGVGVSAEDITNVEK